MQEELGKAFQAKKVKREQAEPPKELNCVIKDGLWTGVCWLHGPIG